MTITPTQLVLRTRPTRGHKVQKHHKNFKTYVQDIPLSPYAYHFQLMTFSFTPIRRQQRVWIEEHLPLEQEVELSLEPLD